VARRGDVKPSAISPWADLNLWRVVMMKKDNACARNHHSSHTRISTRSSDTPAAPIESNMLYSEQYLQHDPECLADALRKLLGSPQRVRNLGIFLMLQIYFATACMSGLASTRGSRALPLPRMEAPVPWQ
jgi:hypothetical protein